MDVDDRIKGLSAAAAARGNEFERYLMRGGIIDMAPTLTQSPGTSHPLLVVMDDPRTTAFFKRFCDQNVNLCAQFGHDRLGPPLNEVTAWRLAHAMGDPWRQMLPTAVLRKINGTGGALINDKRGQVENQIVMVAGGQAKSAGFWDALVGQQDRNARNHRWDAHNRRLGLIDHGFAFAKPGDLFHAGQFHAFRKAQVGTVTQAEQAALEALLSSGDLHGLRDFLDEERADALEARASRMLNSRVILPVGMF